MNTNAARWAALMLTATVSILAARTTAAPASAAPIQPVHAGALAIVEPYDQTKLVTHGDATTQFSVRPPAGATCPGDSANDQWRVQTFIVPASDDPTAIYWGAIGPEPSGNGRYALFGIDTVPYANQFLQRNAVAGQPGKILAVAPLDFSVLEDEGLPSGTYRVGMACTFFEEIAQYWDTEIVVTNTLGESNKLVWRLPSLPDTVNQPKHRNGLFTAAAFAAVVVILLSWFSWRRSRSNRQKRHHAVARNASDRHVSDQQLLEESS